MRRFCLLIIGLALAGCASSSQAPRASVPALQSVALNNPPAAALAFAPPITMGEPALDLSRAGREPEAFLGFSQGTTDTYDVFQDDVQYTDPWTGGYRESFTERSGMMFH